MTELKTLKDLEEENDEDVMEEFELNEEQRYWIYSSKLKAEAVKWVKNELIYDSDKEVVRWIKHFFNLPEEDLKNE